MVNRRSTRIEYRDQAWFAARHMAANAAMAAATPAKRRRAPHSARESAAHKALTVAKRIEGKFSGIAGRCYSLRISSGPGSISIQAWLLARAPFRRVISYPRELV